MFVTVDVDQNHLEIMLSTTVLFSASIFKLEVGERVGEFQQENYGMYKVKKAEIVKAKFGKKPAVTVRVDKDLVKYVVTW